MIDSLVGRKVPSFLEYYAQKFKKCVSVPGFGFGTWKMSAWFEPRLTRISIIFRREEEGEEEEAR